MFKFGTVILCLLLQAILTFSYVSKCVQPGAKCSDCENLNFCVQTAQGFQTHHIISCNNSDGWYCSSQFGGCTNDSKVCKIFGLQSMECQMEGIFPDPYDCTAYHTCVSTGTGFFTSIRGNCNDDRAFDPLTATCRLQPNHHVCKQGPVPKCRRAMQTQALTYNKNIYYICVRKKDDLIPWLYRCRSGETYLTKNQTCVQSEEYSYTSCMGEGKFVDPHDATKYYECRDEKSVAHFSCPANNYYNQEIQQCIQF